MNLMVGKDELEEIFSHENDVILSIKDKHFISANKAALQLIGISSISVFKSFHPAMLSPEFQPDGQSSKTKAEEMMNFALENGSNRFRWQHIKLDGTLFDAEVTLMVKDDNIIHVHWSLLS